MLLTWHNLRYYQRLMQGMRDAIEAEQFGAFASRTRADWAEGDIPVV